MIRVAFLAEMAVMPQVQHAVSRTVLQNWNGTGPAENPIPPAIRGKCVVDGFVREETDAVHAAAASR